MKLNRRLAFLAVCSVALVAAGAAGIAQAVSGSEEQLIGPAAKSAAAAALIATGGGTVLEIERQDGDGAGVYEVEVRRADGSQVEVHLNAQFAPLGTAADDDSGNESEESEGEND